MKQIIKNISLALGNTYKSNEELSAIIRAICCDILGFSPTAYYLKEEVELTTEKQERLDNTISRLQQGEPLQ